MNDVVLGTKEAKNNIPFPLYCTRLYTGKFEFVNAAFAQLLRYPITHFDSIKARTLYGTDSEREEWIKRMEMLGQGILPFVAEYLLGPPHGESDGHTTIPVVDIAWRAHDAEN